MTTVVDEIFNLVEYRFVWLPDYQLKFLESYNNIQNVINTAFVYCKFNQIWATISAFLEPNSEDA